MNTNMVEPSLGITLAGFGVSAVDPRDIPLGTKLIIPGGGRAAGRYFFLPAGISGRA